MLGGGQPLPMRLGGGGVGQPRANRLTKILDSINAMMGTGYDTSPSSNVYLRNMAIARCIDAVWANNNRLAAQWIPSKMSEPFISRWEAILNLTPGPNDGVSARRTRIASVFARFGKLPNQQTLTDELTALLGANVFVSVSTPPANAATQYTPASWPIGTHDATLQWWSSICNVDVQVKQPIGMWQNSGLTLAQDSTQTQTTAELYGLMAQAAQLLDSQIPAWCTYTIYRQDIHAGPGTSTAGFWLDDPQNLDIEAFDV